MNELGIYIHIPFCRSKCNYCDFNSYGGMEDVAEEYCKQVEKEIKIFSRQNDTKDIIVKTIYMGGGTPSHIPSSCLEGIAETIFTHFKGSEKIEFTVEANPKTMDREKLAAYGSMGVNRLSIGLQAWQDRILKAMGRTHTAADFVESVELARSQGICNINCDLIFGYPGQTLKDWHETLANVLKFDLPHLSCYSLSIEPDTPLGRMVASGKLEKPDDRIDRAMYHDTMEILQRHGYVHYEISNFSMENMVSVHNMIYWDAKPYLGFGAGAHSFYGGRRFHNIKDPLIYMDEIKAWRLPVEENRLITNQEFYQDYTFLRLRLMEGVKFSDFKNRFGEDFICLYGKEIAKLSREGLIVVSKDGICLSKKGLDLANQVFMEFL